MIQKMNKKSGTQITQTAQGTSVYNPSTGQKLFIEQDTRPQHYRSGWNLEGKNSGGQWSDVNWAKDDITAALEMLSRYMPRN